MFKKNFIILSLSLLSLLLPSCNNSDNNDNKKNFFDETTFNEYRASSLKIKGESITTFIDASTNSPIKIPSTSEVHFSNGAYSFFETYKDNLIDEISAKYYRNDDGYAVGKSISINNEVITQDVIYSSTGEKVIFDSNYANPFYYLEYNDLVSLENSNEFKIIDEEVGENFTNPIAFNNEKFYSLKITYKNGILEAFYQGRTSKYSVESKFTFFKTDEVVKEVSPYKHEAFHEEILAAFKEMEQAESFTYKKERINIDNENDVTTLYSKITKDALLYPADTFTAHERSYGTAKFDDGNIYSFEINENNEVIRNSTPIDEHDRPIFNTCAPELFIKTDAPNFYRLDNYTYSCLTAANMVETYDEESLIMMMGLQGNLVIEVIDSKLISFSYIITRVYENSLVTELNSIYIEDVNNTVIPYEFKI